MIMQHYPFELLPLPYLYDSLEPHIDTETMYLHHSRHLRTYVDNLNRLLKPYPEFHDWTLERLILASRDTRPSGFAGNPSENKKLPEDIRQGVWNNAGGVYNHQFYFAGMTPKHTELSGKLKDALYLDFETWDDFYEAFFEMALKVFGSGYLWLAADERGKLVILPLPNQDTPLPQGLTPILNLDLWEHAYYLKHKNLRAGYIRAWFQTINWEEAERRYQNALLQNALQGSRTRNSSE